jgi:hypothetical protein
MRKLLLAIAILWLSNIANAYVLTILENRLDKNTVEITLHY